MYSRSLLIVVLLFLFASMQEPAQGAKYDLNFGGDFTLTDQYNKSFSLHDVRGKVAMIFFGFTSCADTCPTTMIRMSATMKLLGPLAEKAQPIFITVDAKRDTPSVIRQYAEYFHPSIIALTGTQEQLEKVAAQYRTPVLVREPDKNGFYVVDHGSHLFLLDPDGELANILMFEDSPERIAEQVLELLQ
jgi:cytochrome oxidase Cu insertion factor (SCO1/SenC/PrrC family)